MRGGSKWPTGQEIGSHFSQDHATYGHKISWAWEKIRIFWDWKSQNQFFFNFFITKSPNFISNLNDDCSQLSFEVYNICVAQKLRILEFLIKFFGPYSKTCIVKVRAGARRRKFRSKILKSAIFEKYKRYTPQIWNKIWGLCYKLKKKLWE